jgi:hypothetical protein
VLFLEMSFPIVLSTEAVLCSIDRVCTVCMGTVKASTIMLRLVSDEILLARKGNLSGKTGLLKTAVALPVVLPMLAERR